jgi:hypothetical protein
VIPFTGTGISVGITGLQVSDNKRNGGEGEILLRYSDSSGSKFKKQAIFALYGYGALGRHSAQSVYRRCSCLALSKKPTRIQTIYLRRECELPRSHPRRIRLPPPWYLFLCGSIRPLNPVFDLRLFSTLATPASLSYQLSQNASPQACSTATDTDSASSSRRLNQDLRWYIEFLV